MPVARGLATLESRGFTCHLAKDAAGKPYLHCHIEMGDLSLLEVFILDAADVVVEVKAREKIVAV